MSNKAGSKRGACDRCRGQKLRCLPRDPTQNSTAAICARCQKAGAECSFGIAKRPGRPPTANNTSSHSRKGDGSGKDRTLSGANPRRDELWDHLNGQDNRVDEGQSWNLASGGEGDQLTRVEAENRQSSWENRAEDPNHAFTLSPSLHDAAAHADGISLDFPSFVRPSLSNLPWPQDAFTSSQDNGIGEIPDLDSFDSSRFDWLVNGYHGQPMDIQLPTFSSTSKNDWSDDGRATSYTTPLRSHSTTSSASTALEEAMHLESPTRPNHTARVMPTKASKARQMREPKGRRDMWPVSADLGVSPAQNAREESAGTDDERGASTGNHAQHRRVQALSKLAMNLYAQVLASDPGKQQFCFGTPTTPFRHDLVGSVLNSSNNFLALLASFPTPTTSPSSLCPLLPSTPVDSVLSSSSPNSSEGSSSIASFLDPEDSMMSKSGRQCLPTTQSSDSKPSAPADLTTVLQLVTCYMHIIHLHSIMHSHVLDYVLNFSSHDNEQADDPIPPVFQGMQIGGVSLDPFGTSQVKLLLQISLRVLSNIEVALGLPDEYRVGKRKSGTRGVLEASVSEGFLKSLMEEEAWRVKKVESVRERLGSLRRALREG